MNSKMLTVEEAAIYIHRSRSYLDKSRTEGNIGNRTPGPVWHKIGPNVYYTIEDLDEWIAQYRVERSAI